MLWRLLIALAWIVGVILFLVMTVGLIVTAPVDQFGTTTTTTTEPTIG